MVAPRLRISSMMSFTTAGVHGIEAREGLVQNDQRRLMDDGGNELHFLLHALGEVDHFLIGPVAQPEALEPFAGTASGFGLRKASQSPEEHDQIAHLHSRIEPALFRKVSDGLARFVSHRQAEDANRAFVWNENVHHHADRSGLAGAVGAKQAQDGALTYLQVHAAHGGDGVV